MNELTIQNAHLFLEEFYGVEENKQTSYNIYICDDCGVDKVVYDCFLVCPECGLMDINNPIYDDVPDYVPKPSLYKRRLYCQEKLNMMAGYKHSNSPKYKELLKELKEHEFENLTELRDLMKKLNFNKFYKFIYNIYFDIKKVRLIQLTYNDIDKISRRFIEIETKFRTEGKHKRKNMLSYNAMIYFILKEMGYKCYSNVLLPQNFKHVEKLFETLWECSP